MLLEEELALVARSQSGDKAALGMLWDAITPKLHGYLVNTVRDKQLAEDLLQDTWLKAITSLHKFKPRGVRFSAWLFAIARNECRMHWRGNGREVAIEENDFPGESPRQAANDKILVDLELKKLSVEYQEVLRLRFISEFSFKEIAQILGISPITARVRVHRALGKVRANLKNI